ncbi:hypothetical protein E2C01_028759 [Portunus trituberculatus]|uniref:Uncharacterized protein n=1 Tax=Portunus trituberculatus TaxID=210409 RepID=A0A5B7EQ27_PORTR|nr:hypothetical protein [Portunus trituberculatus]
MVKNVRRTSKTVKNTSKMLHQLRYVMEDCKVSPNVGATTSRRTAGQEKSKPHSMGVIKDTISNKVRHLKEGK